MNYLALFFAGALLCNSLPHLAMGLAGLPFPTPFAKPRGKGDSSPHVNFHWGLFNLVVGVLLLYAHPVTPGWNGPFVVLIAGALVLGDRMSRRFGEVQRAKRQGGQ
ncbi:hypothetical protein [Silvimonas iriomotensis]|uniref:Integral membrane protein n=1 Tax=Silvimonas iriomotensis TaxID=449662 RepID=A0ABQ2P9L1_9NEIS|nr:hypothetical protein [Silvimonas iriomotensis]GGP21509.1 hypothetical protein GCM10010970_20830 [Silvimonas iriomotensis]